MSDQILSTAERVAEQLDVGRTTVYALMASGELASVKIGRSRRIPADAVTTYIERLRRDALTDQPQPAA